MTRMFIKIHDSYRKVVAVCDGDLLGNKFEEGKKQLDVRTSFYQGEEIDEERLAEKFLRLRNDDATFNLVGENTLRVALRTGIITKENIGRVDGTPFALGLV